MNTRTLALLALLLWSVTIALAAWFFVKGNTLPAPGGRTAVLLAADERELILQEMRGLLQSVQRIVDGLNRHDNAQVADAARRVGMASAADVSPTLMAKLPLTFKQLGMSVHHDMDRLAAAAEQNGDPAVLQGMLASTLSKCVACHSGWQLNTRQ